MPMLARRFWHDVFSRCDRYRPPPLAGMVAHPLVPLFNILMIDLTLAGDNAIVVGMAASRVQPDMRAKVIFWGIAGAVILRIIFAGRRAADAAGDRPDVGGRHPAACSCAGRCTGRSSIARAIDRRSREKPRLRRPARQPCELLGRSLDHHPRRLVDVARQRAGGRGAAGESTLVLVIGLAVAIVLMAVASNYIAKLLGRYPWIAWIGLLIILYVALDMIYRDIHRIACVNYGIGCSETIWDGIMHRLGLGG